MGASVSDAQCMLLCSLTQVQVKGNPRDCAKLSTSACLYVLSYHLMDLRAHTNTQPSRKLNTVHQSAEMRSESPSAPRSPSDSSSFSRKSAESSMPPSNDQDSASEDSDFDASRKPSLPYKPASNSPLPVTNHPDRLDPAAPQNLPHDQRTGSPCHRPNTASHSFLLTSTDAPTATRSSKSPQSLGLAAIEARSS